MLFVGFALAYNFSSVVVSIQVSGKSHVLMTQAYWAIVAPGQAHLYGFLFGCFCLTQLVFTPILSWLTCYLGLRNAVIGALALSVGGNVIYALAMYTKTESRDTAFAYTLGMPSMLIIGRLVSGVGSAALGLGAAFMRDAPPKERLSTVSAYQTAQVHSAKIVVTYVMLI